MSEDRMKFDASLEGSVWHFMDADTVGAYGPWVRECDYRALSARLAEVEAERDRLRKALRDIEAFAGHGHFHLSPTDAQEGRE